MVSQIQPPSSTLDITDESPLPYPVIFDNWFFLLGYWVKFWRKPHAFFCRYMIRKGNYWMPRTLKLRGSSIRELSYIIGAYYEQNLVVTQKYEENGHVTDLSYDAEPNRSDKPEMLTVSPKLLQAVADGTLPLQIPEGFGITFCQSARQAWAEHVSSAMVEKGVEHTLDRIEREVAHLALRKRCTFRWSALREIVCPELIPFHLVRQDNKGRLVAAPPTPPTLIHERKLPHDVTERLEVIDGECGYFIRTFTHNKKVIWSGSSYSPTGPWNIYHHDPYLCVAAGITEIPELEGVSCPSS